MAFKLQVLDTDADSANIQWLGPDCACAIKYRHLVGRVWLVKGLAVRASAAVNRSHTFHMREGVAIPMQKQGQNLLGLFLLKQVLNMRMSEWRERTSLS